MDSNRKWAKEEQSVAPAIWKVDRFATHDGPGIRTNLYFKGCPLGCLWCSNPEGQREGMDLSFEEGRCTGCEHCLYSCPEGAITPLGGRPGVNFGKCNRCGRCVLRCATGALSLYGRGYGLTEVMEIVQRDRHMYRRSGGGITCTGGEPFFQVGFLKLLLTRSHQLGIHTAVETSAYAEPVEFVEALANIDWLFVDLKHIDPDQHRTLTGRENAVIVNNLRLASSAFAREEKVLVIRQVVVPGLNDGDNVEATAQLARGLPRVDMIELLPYQAYGAHKYRALGRRYSPANLEGPSESDLLTYKGIVESYGLRCKIGDQ